MTAVEQFTARVMSLQQAIGEEQDAFIRGYGHFVLLIVPCWHPSQRHPGRTQFPHCTCVSSIGEIVPRVGVAQLAAPWIKERLEAGDNHLWGSIGTEQRVDPRQDLSCRVRSVC